MYSANVQQAGLRRSSLVRGGFLLCEAESHRADARGYHFDVSIANRSSNAPGWHRLAAETAAPLTM